MITANVIQRVFFFKSAQYGTAFSLHVDGREYLITAKHLLNAFDDSIDVRIKHDKNWHKLNAKIVGIGAHNVDIAVLALDKLLAPNLPMSANSADAIVGQDVYFLGYPYMLWTDAGEAGGGWPFPFIKKGILSSSFDDGDGIHRFFVDALSNNGFSGGPIVFKNEGLGNFQVGAVVSRFRTERERVLDKNGEPTGDEIEYNTGFMVGDSIDYAIEIIARNPIGIKA